MKLSDRGFTLLEVMQASALATVSLLGVSSLLLTAIHANTKAHDITAAATAAQAKMEELRSLPYDSVDGGSDGVTESSASYVRTWTVFTGPTAGTKLVTVRVEAVQRAPIELRTILVE